MPRLNFFRRNTQRPKKRDSFSPRSSQRRRTFRFYLFSFALLALLAIGVFFSSAKGDRWLAAQKNHISHKLLILSVQAGLTVKDIHVVGREWTSREEILEIVNLRRGSPLFAFDPHLVQRDLERLPWVHHAVVERLLPDTVTVYLIERHPVALWQTNKRLVLIDEAGMILTDKQLEEFKSLPILVGPEAPQHAKALFADLSKVPRVWQKLDAATWVSNRRWDLRLDNGTTIRLPEEKVAGALAQLAAVDAQHKLLDRDVVSIDLRIPDRMIIQPVSTSEGKKN